METTNCCICAESYNRSNRLEVKCEYCDFVACRLCFETYLLSQTTPHCMLPNDQCGKIWTRNFISKTFTIAFITTKYKEHREHILFEQELSLMPATQLIIERRKYKKQKILDYSEELSDLHRSIHELTVRKDILENRVRRLRVILNSDDVDFNETDELKNDDVSSTKKFIHRCSNENCRGFLSSNWNCELCDTSTCSKCHMNIGTIEDKEDKENHVCNENDVETAKMIKKDSKPCPKCGIIIFKIDGCDQMYCTQCHTPFSWRTGDIQLTQNIHNPHYFEYIRTHGNGAIQRNPMDVLCGRDLNMNFVSRLNALLVYFSPIFNSQERHKITDMCRYISSYDTNIHDYRTTIENSENRKKDYRISYLTSMMSEKDFKKIIQINDKKIQKNREYMNVFIMLRDANKDMIYLIHDKLEEVEKSMHIVSDGLSGRIYNDFTYSKNEEYTNRINLTREMEFKKNNLDENIIFMEFENLRKYANNCFEDIARTYNCKSCKYIGEQYNILNTNVRKIKPNKNKNVTKNDVIDVTDDMDNV